MTARSSQLCELLDELHAVNQTLAEAARPLQWLSDMDLEKRKQLADHIRASLVRWENVTERISSALCNGSDDVTNQSRVGAQMLAV